MTAVRGPGMRPRGQKEDDVDELGTAPRASGRWSRTPVARWPVAVAVGLALVAVPSSATARTTGGEPLVTVSGTPLVHTFDLAVPGDAAVGEWGVSTSAASPTPFDGSLAADEPVPDPAFAEALVVQYGTLDGTGRVVAWHDAGTLAEPVSLSQALGRPTTVAAGEPARVPVRVRLPDPGALDLAPGRSLAVTATFTVDYLSDDTAATPPARPVAGHGPLAMTGADLRLLGLLGAAGVLAGSLLRGTRTRDRRDHPAGRAGSGGAGDRGWEAG